MTTAFADMLTVHNTDAITALREMTAESVQCVVTSPPYWGLRDYGLAPLVWDGDVECSHEFIDKAVYKDSPTRSGNEGVGFDNAQTTKAQRWKVSGTCSLCGAWRGCLGLEPTPELYVRHMVHIFRDVSRVLHKNGTLWLNLGDSYATGGGAVGRCPSGGEQGERFLRQGHINTQPNRMPLEGLKPKDLIGIPWRVAFALQADGWWLRSDIIWSKPNPMPESVTDRPTRAHEYIFLLTKSQKYFYDAEAIKEPASMFLAQPDGNGSTITGGSHNRHTLAEEIPEKQRRTDRQRGHSRRHAGFNDRWDAMEKAQQCGGLRNKRSVWEIPTTPFPEAHFATFPKALVIPCVLAGSKAGDVVMDPFGGSGTVGKVAIELGRKAILIEPKAEYVAMIEKRTTTTMGLPL